MADRPHELPSRRAFLRGVGVAAALPYLETFAPARPPAVRRLVCVSFPNGASLPEADDEKHAHWRWFPRRPGPDYEFTDVLACLQPHRDRLSLIGGLSHPLSRELLGHLAGDTWLTGGDLRGDAYRNRISVDQVAARALAAATRLPSLVLSTDGGVGYKSRVSTLSFDHTGTPIPAECRPRAIFERCFAPGGGAPTAARRRTLQQGRRIVDLVLEDGRALQQRLSRRDRQKLDEYLESLHAVERQIERDEAWLDRPLAPVAAKDYDLAAGPAVDPAAYLRTMYDLVALACETDLTRVITFQSGREDGMGFADQFPQRALGIKRTHHTISHDTHEGHWEDWGRFDQWNARQFVHLLDRLAAASDDAGPVLDSTMVLYGSCCSTTHNARNYPTVLAGGGAMGLRHGSYTVFGEDRTFADLLHGMLSALGVDVPSFADSEHRLPEIFGPC